MAVDEVGVGGARDVEDVGRAHPHFAPLEAVGDRRAETVSLGILNERAERALPVVVVVALEFQIADDCLGRLKAPVGQQHHVIAIEGLGVAAPGLNHERAVKPGLLLKHRVAVVPVRAALMDREAVDKGLAGRDPAEAETRHAVHRRGRAYAMPVDRARLAQAVGDGQRQRVALAPAQDRRRDLAVDAGCYGLAAIDGERDRFDCQSKLSAVEDRRAAGRGQCGVQRPRSKRKRAGCGPVSHEATAGEGRNGERRDAVGGHRLPPAGVIALISYIPPWPCSIVKLTRVPALMVLRSTEAATEKSMVIAGQPISGIGLWLRFTLCCVGSTELTVPVPWASLWPACAIRISLPCCGSEAWASAASAARVGTCGWGLAVTGPEPPRSTPSGTAVPSSATVGPELMQAIRAIGNRPIIKGR